MCHVNCLNVPWEGTPRWVKGAIILNLIGNFIFAAFFVEAYINDRAIFTPLYAFAENWLSTMKAMSSDVLQVVMLQYKFQTGMWSEERMTHALSLCKNPDVFSDAQASCQRLRRLAGQVVQVADLEQQERDSFDSEPLTKRDL